MEVISIGGSWNMSPPDKGWGDYCTSFTVFTTNILCMYLALYWLHQRLLAIDVSPAPRPLPRRQESATCQVLCPGSARE